MKVLLSFVVLFTAFHFGYAQKDIPETKTIKIEGDKEKSNTNTNLILKPKEEDKKMSLNMPNLIGKKPDYNLRDSLTKRQIHMLPQRNLVRAGHDLKLDPKIGIKADKNSGAYFGDSYIGDIKYNGKFVGIVCRDHEFVDGDRIRILVNGKEVEPNLFLTGSFKGINVDLVKGFNRVEFEALNEGSSSPNTAQINVYDDKGELIYADQWYLSTGSKATFIVTKE